MSGKFTLDKTKLNEPILESLRELIVTAKSAHFTDVHVRINGEWQRFEADWIKMLEEDEK